MLKTVFLEDPFYILVFLVVTALCLLVVASKRRTRRWWLSPLVPAAMAGVVLLISSLVTTDRERIDKALHDLATAAKAGDISAVEPYIADDYYDGRRHKAQILALGKDVAANIQFDDITFMDLDIRMGSPAPTSTFRTLLTVAHSSYGMVRMSVRWSIQWVKRGDRWQIISVHWELPPQIAGGA